MHDLSKRCERTGSVIYPFPLAKTLAICAFVVRIRKISSGIPSLTLVLALMYNFHINKMDRLLF